MRAVKLLWGKSGYKNTVSSFDIYIKEGVSSQTDLMCRERRQRSAATMDDQNKLVLFDLFYITVIT